MNQEQRSETYSQFFEDKAVFFTTDLGARGLDYEKKAVDWVVQVDCPSDVKTYIHRVGRTARYNTGGKALLFLDPSEIKMLERLENSKIPIVAKKVNRERLQSISSRLAENLVRFPGMQQLAQTAFVTYLRAIRKEKDKEIFDVMKLDIDDFSASLGLPLMPKIRFINWNSTVKSPSEANSIVKLDEPVAEKLLDGPGMDGSDSDEDESDNDLLGEKRSLEVKPQIPDIEAVVPTTRVLKKKKLKINVNRPIGTRVVFDEEGNDLPPLAALADKNGGSTVSAIDKDKVQERYQKERQKLKEADKFDKQHAREFRKEKRVKKKEKLKRGRTGEGEDGDENNVSGSDENTCADRPNKKSKLYFDSGSEDEKMDLLPKKISLAEQEALALKILSSMHS